MPNQAQLDAFSQKVASTLGRDRLVGLLPQQENLLDRALMRILARREGDASKVTSDEILGAYEMITEDVFPTWIGPVLKELSQLTREEAEGRGIDFETILALRK